MSEGFKNSIDCKSLNEAVLKQLEEDFSEISDDLGNGNVPFPEDHKRRYDALNSVLIGFREKMIGSGDFDVEEWIRQLEDLNPEGFRNTDTSEDIILSLKKALRSVKEKMVQA
jgi:hypothetical protein